MHLHQLQPIPTALLQNLSCVNRTDLAKSSVWILQWEFGATESMVISRLGILNADGLNIPWQFTVGEEIKRIRMDPKLSGGLPFTPRVGQKIAQRASATAFAVLILAARFIWRHSLSQPSSN